jgi:hypothetical protein
MSKLPREAVKQYFPFYPAMWLTSRRLRVCSPAARGVLIDLMAMAWEDGGKVCEDLDVLAVSMGLPPADLQTHLDELVKRERISITTKKGTPPVIHVPHLEAIHAEAIAYIEARQADGKRGADARYKGAHRDPIGCLQGAHALTGTDRTGPDATGTDQNIPEEKKPKKEPVPFPFRGDVEAEQALETWLTFKKERHENYKPTGLDGLYRSIEKMGRDRFIAAVALSTASNYAGLVDRAAPGNGGMGQQPRRASQAVTVGGPGSTLEGVLKMVEEG